MLNPKRSRCQHPRPDDPNKRLCLIAVVFLTIFCIHAFASSATIESNSKLQIVLGIGHQEKLDLKSSHPILLGNAKIASAKEVNNQLILTGKSLGSTSLNIGDTHYELHVLPPNKVQSFFQLQAYLTNKRGLNLIIRDQTPIIEGRLLRFSDWSGLQNLQLSANSFQFKAQMTKQDQEAGRRLILEKMQTQGQPVVDVQCDWGCHMNISKDHAASKPHVDSLMSTLGVTVNIVDSIMTLSPMIETKITIAEIKRQHLMTLGVSWPSAFSLIPHADSTSQDAGFKLATELKALETRGFGKILASPSLLCQSGKQAEFLSGGEFPIRLISRSNKEVIWKKHGISLVVKPVADSRGQMSIEIQSELSMLDASQVIEGIPGLRTNRLQSQFNLAKPTTIVLSGLYKSEWGRSAEGLPGLSQIPILGYLFKSQDFMNQESELIIFVTPQIIQPDHMENPDRLQLQLEKTHPSKGEL